MNDEIRVTCDRCRGRGYLKKASNDPYGHSFDILFQIIPVLGIFFLTILLYMIGLLSASFVANNWLGLLVSGLVTLYIVIGCMLNIWRMIFSERIPCLTCMGSGLIEHSEEKTVEQ